MTPIRLTCHCGQCELSVARTEPLTTAVRCDCSFCRRRGAMTVAAPLDAVTVVMGDALTLYQFGPKSERHWFCSICGCYTHHQRTAKGREYGLNVGGLAGINPRDIDPVPWMDGVNYNPDQQEGL